MDNSWINDQEGFQAKARKVEPGVILLPNDIWIGRVLSGMLFLLIPDFIDNWAITLGPVQLYPRDWSEDKVWKVFLHEAEHTRQMKKLGLGSAWLGFPIFALLYLFLLPIGFNYFRYKFERDAELSKLQHLYTLKALTSDEVLQQAETKALLVSSRAYGWAVPKQMALKGYLNAAKEITRAA